MELLLLYFVALGVVCLRDLFKVKSFDDYVVAGRRQGAPFVFMSLMATVLGASATVGVAGRAEHLGFAAFWWLGVGAVGFWFQAAFLTKPIYELNVRTLPELAEKTVGRVGRKLVAFIIAVSWIGVIAAQFAALSGFVGLVLGYDSGVLSVVLPAIVVIIYTLVGGQLSVVRTDALQFGILVVAFVLALVYLFGGFAGATLASGVSPDFDIALLNSEFSVADLAMMLFTVGGAFFLGPDVISRNLVAKNASAARKAVVAGSFAILFFGIVIVLLGMWASKYIPNESANPLFRLASGVLPLPLAALLSVGLLSALLSSADTCLINSAAIFGSDLLNTKRIAVVRALVVVVGVAAMLLAVEGKDIIGLLTMAYSVYTPGIVAPLAVAIIAHKKYTIKRPLWYAGVCLGGLFGLVPAVLYAVAKVNTPLYLPHIGIVVSLIFALFSLKKRMKMENAE